MAKSKKVKASRNKAKDVESVKKVLFIKDRIAVRGVLPKEGDILTMTLARDIGSKVELKQADFKKFKIEVLEGGRLKWDVQKKGVSFTFTRAEIELLKSRITELDKQKKISGDLLDFCILMRE